MATYTGGSGYSLQPFLSSGGKFIDAFQIPSSGNVDPYTGKQLAVVTQVSMILGGTGATQRMGLWEAASQRWATGTITLNGVTATSSSATATETLSGLAWVVHTGANYYCGAYATSSLAAKRNTSTGSFSSYTTASGGNESNAFTGTTVSQTYNPANLYFVVTYYRLPNAPAGTPSISLSGSTVRLSWTAATAVDTGGAGDVTGYKIQVSYNSGTSWSTWIENTGSTSTGAVDITTGDGGATFKAGQTVRFRVAAKNGVCVDFTPLSPSTSTYYAAGVYGTTLSSGPYGSASADATLPGGVYNGSSWVPLSNAKVYNGSTWVTPSSFKVYDGATWKSLI